MQLGQQIQALPHQGLGRLQALQRWPALHTKLKLKKSHNMAEAALLGAWFYEHHPAGRDQEKVLTAQNFW